MSVLPSVDFPLGLFCRSSGSALPGVHIEKCHTVAPELFCEVLRQGSLA